MLTWQLAFDIHGYATSIQATVVMYYTIYEKRISHTFKTAVQVLRLSPYNRSVEHLHSFVLVEVMVVATASITTNNIVLTP